MMRKALYIGLFALVLLSCANRGIGPQGGPKDSIPPIPLRSNPENGALEFKGNRIEVAFNEYLQLDNVSQNLMMSPPQQRPPEVKARGKHLIIQFVDSLRDSTTYTLDFGAAVCDYTEKNPLHGYSFAFSTGSVIDTMEARGRVYDAENMNPKSGIMVGIHSDLADSMFTTQPFLRIARTDSMGYFRIGNMRAGKYRLYAVDDVSRDYRLTPGEALAFADELIEAQLPERPKSAPVRRDSVPSDTLRVALDSISATSTSESEESAHLTPLFLFKQQQKKLYLQRTLREQQHQIKVLFSSSPDSLPIFTPLQPDLHFYPQYSTHGDTTMLWLTDSAAIKLDTLFFEVRFRRTDSLYHLEWATDTIRAIWRAPRISAKAQQAQARRNRNRRLELKSNARKDFELYDTLYLACSSPLARIAVDSIHLFEKIDTVLKPVPFTLAPYDSLTMRLTFLADLEAGKNYELKLDSGALHDVYGVTHIAASYPLQLKTPADYSTLKVKLNPFVPKARLQVLNSQDKVVREMAAEPEGAVFRYLKADTYYLRMYIDANDDGQWTTGSWEEKRQPEAIFYNPEKVQTKSNWDFEEEWVVPDKPRPEDKPAVLIKK